MSQVVRIPADVEMADKVLGPFTARQLLLLTVPGLLLYVSYGATRSWLPLPIFLAFAIPVAGAAALLALGRRDGIGMDAFVLAAIRQRMSPSRRVAAPEGVRPAPEWVTASQGDDAVPAVSPAPLRLPAEAVTDTGVIDLGRDGLAVVAVCGSVNFSLRTGTEQEALVATFGRYLHSLTAPVQILIRAERLDLSGQISELHERAGALPHPSLEAAAREHADYLAHLSATTDLLRRQILLVLREPLGTLAQADTDGRSVLAVLGARRRKRLAQQSEQDDAVRRAAETRLARRLAEAAELLTPAGITVTVLDAGQATSVLSAALNPDSLLPPSSGLAGADEVITTAAGSDWDDHDEHQAHGDYEGKYGHG
ncbi:PrgI family protein [Actinokineospora inagensis]|uniref:PrgI family protein n=1 Tax=Actinokineospora inagensis TaxID=103730 RepID=UPI00040303EE|nr:PrgI family protein [Actinokineospora inagensis]